ncbi:MAG: hypothetical protein DMD79_08290 [Candidatus Rokuibacteriota bacterium]|nr:MAG: hypothetical protein DMD79_08290 [Candidatus Rokubacteria bacterium]
MRAPRSWFTGKARADVFDAKGVVEGVVAALGRGEVGVEPTEAPFLEEGRAASVLVDGTVVGHLGELHPAVREAFDLQAPVLVSELSLDRLEALPGRAIVYRPLARFPAVARDLAVVVPDTVPAAEVGRLIEAGAEPCLRRVTLFDVYQGEQIGRGRKSLAYGLVYQAEDRTLTDSEVNQMHAQVIERLRTTLEAEVRGADRSGP